DYYCAIWHRSATGFF
nr:immunoglobulin light chain junction region [Macaca mulatta]MOX78093.1 immunoglobulin light chain junction region [Macaca mulatta]MOX78385.1 immunoglobulin light chain junction region [Macaca mulatta]MOX78505.1 immunoglobulin light chain junction region [Macaca mulatta]MOX79270.1 immunoglobulin light chain junction region [Macaca mulatta]